VVVIYSVIKLTLVLGNESSLLSTHPVVNNADTLQFGDIFKISVNEDRLYSCSIQLHVIGVTEGREQCWVSDLSCVTSVHSYTFDLSGLFLYLISSVQNSVT